MEREREREDLPKKSNLMSDAYPGADLAKSRARREEQTATYNGHVMIEEHDKFPLYCFFDVHMFY